MSIVLDTGAFFRPRELAKLEAFPGRIVVPAVAAAERIRQLRVMDRSAEEFVSTLRDGRYEVESFALDQALAMPVVADPHWRRHARDAMIAAHVQPGDVLWTTNPRDFLALGLSPEQIRAV